MQWRYAIANQAVTGERRCPVLQHLQHGFSLLHEAGVIDYLEEYLAAGVIKFGMYDNEEGAHDRT